MKCKYRIRRFYSKGAFLVLLWTALICIGCAPQIRRYAGALESFSDLELPIHTNWLIVIPLLVACFSTPLIGWLADARFEVYRAGIIMLLLYMVINCFLLVIEALSWENNSTLKWIYFSITSTLFVIGTSIWIVTTVPLGLDQMPDASSSSITSFIAWLVCSIYIGRWVTNDLVLIKEWCVDKEQHFNYSLTWALFSTICMNIVLVSDFIFSPKWLIIEPKSPQSLRTMYGILKFAAKHKAPINRSALTYWEKNIPSRIDLGKSKYGGPYTTEDVKTILRLLVMCLPISFINFSFSLQSME